MCGDSVMALVEIDARYAVKSMADELLGKANMVSARFQHVEILVMV